MFEELKEKTLKDFDDKFGTFLGYTSILDSNNDSITVDDDKIKSFLSQIFDEIESCVPEEKKFNPNLGFVSLGVRALGFNSALTEIKERINKII